MDKPVIVEELKHIEKSHGGSLNHWVDRRMYITVQNCYDLQYLNMRLSEYMNYSIEHDFRDIINGMEYLMHHPHKTIMYSRFVKINEIPHQFFFKSGDAEIKKSGILQLSSYIL